MPDRQTNIKIAISGATGYIGSTLAESFRQNNYSVIEIRRKDFEKSPKELAAKIEGCNYIINLSGAPINRKWTV